MNDRELLQRWKAFVDAVERGYEFGIEDYRNDLDIRTLIARAGLDQQAHDDDERLRGLLTATGKDVWESETADAFWVRGYPRNASGELLDDLRAEKLA